MRLAQSGGTALVTVILLIIGVGLLTIYFVGLTPRSEGKLANPKYVLIELLVTGLIIFVILTAWSWISR